MIATLYARFYQEISNFLQSLARDQAEAEDLAQDTFMRALQHADLFLDMTESQCRAWLYRTARNLFIDKARRRQRIRFEALSESGGEDDTSQVYVAQMLAKLPPEDRTFFYLRHFEGMNATQLSEQYGLTPSAIRSRLMKCRAILSQQIDQQRREEP
ncbi:MAG: sigma-70 family RNA polymerase sigma factor [Eubacteriales bacterium]|nr:sigma-70 family RNA polymerase sigma factor [Eubacteriales bacterium]